MSYYGLLCLLISLRICVSERNYMTLNQALQKYESDDNHFNAGNIKILFVEVDVSKINLEYFQFLLEEFLKTNSEKSLSFLESPTKLAIIISRYSTIEPSILKSVFSDYIVNCYIREKSTIDL